MSEHGAYISLTTPRQYTQHGGWNVVCECGLSLGDTGDEAGYRAAYDDHLKGVESEPRKTT